MFHMRFASRQHKALLYALQDGRCAICDADLDESEADHKIRYANGGKTETWNMQLLCIPCHKDKTRRSDSARDSKT